MAEHSDAPESKRLLSIDVLRGIAALAVTITHIHHSHGNGIDWVFIVLLPIDFGTIGVPLFLVISGFCIHLRGARSMARGESPRIEWIPFWKRRFIRLYPPYVATIILSMVIFSIFLPSQAAQYWSDFYQWSWDLISHLGMFHNLTDNFWNGMSNPPLWSLGLEEQLYAMYFVMLLFRTKWSAINVLKISLAVSITWRLAIPVFGWILVHIDGIPREDHNLAVGPVLLGNWSMWPFGWWFLWVLGAIVAEAWCGLIRLPNWATSRSCMVLFAIFGLVTHESILGRYGQFWIPDVGTMSVLRTAVEMTSSLSDLAISLAGAIVLLRWLNAEKQQMFHGRIVNFLAWIGTISYSLYLTHTRTIFLVEHHFPVTGRLSIVIRFLLCIPLCLFVAWCFYYLIERHFIGSSVRRK